MCDNVKRGKLSLKRKTVEKISSDEKPETSESAYRNDSKRLRSLEKDDILELQDNTKDLICDSTPHLNLLSQQLTKRLLPRFEAHLYEPLPIFKQDASSCQLENAKIPETKSSKVLVSNVSFGEVIREWTPLPPPDRELWRRKPLDLALFYGDYNRYEKMQFDTSMDIDAERDELPETLNSQCDKITNAKLDASSPCSSKDIILNEAMIVISSARDKNCSLGKSENKLLLEQCPLCQHQFMEGSSQMDIDEHIAGCLAVCDDDVSW